MRSSPITLTREFVFARARLATSATIGLACLMALAAPGCQREYRQFERQLASSLESGRYDEASSLAATALQEVDEDDGDRAIYLLEAARSAQIAGDLAASRRHLDEFESRVRPYLDVEAEATISEAIATTAVNQTVREYRGTSADRVLASGLNAFNAMALGDLDSARVELNRAADWQQDALERESDRIDRDVAEAKKQAEAEGVRVDSAAVREAVAPVFENLEALEPYADFANPFVEHLRGVYYLVEATDQSDLDRARFSFRRVAAMVPDAAGLIERDLELVKQAGRGGIPATTWVYFFTGLAPRLEQFRIDVPIPVGEVNYVAAAFPVMKFDGDFAEPLEIRGDGRLADTVTVANLDRIFGTEFRGRLPAIVAQEILSASLKAAATYGLQVGLGEWGQFAGILYQATSTSADTRSWRSAPKRIGVARLATPPDGTLSLRVEGRDIGVIRLDPGSTNIVVATLPSSRTPTASIVQARLRPVPARVAVVPEETVP